MSYSGTGNFGLLERGRFGTGLRSAGVEDEEYGVNVTGGEGGENGDELGIGWIHEGEKEPLVYGGLIGGV